MHRRRFLMGAGTVGLGNIPAQALQKLTPGMIPPPFSRAGLDGKPVDLAAFNGKVVLLDFWASWCAPCMVAIPHFRDLQARLRGRGFQVIGISMDDSADQARAAAIRLGVNYPVVMGDAKLAIGYGGILGLPVEMLVGRDGRIVSIWRGETPPAIIENAVKASLG
ncbi:MAG TPA: TlpA disulfide reductase family protein [Rhizomicrobium sp.]|nr:TlpA disulfide reductase family protein [Rhizomicrobium sp.]